MSACDAANWLWVFDAPRDILAPSAQSKLSRTTLLASLASSLFSYSLAETFMAQPLHPLVRAGAPLAWLCINFSLQCVAFSLVLGMLYEFLRVFRDQPTPFGPWFSIGVMALLPLHLLLPLALLCRPLGTGGYLIYTLGELGIAAAMIRRWAWGVQMQYEWPLWGAYLLVLSPLLIICLGILFCTALFLTAISLVLFGAIL